MPFEPPLDPDVDEEVNRATRKASRLLDNIITRVAGRAQRGIRTQIPKTAPADEHRGRSAASETLSQWYYAEFVATEHMKAVPILFGYRRPPALLTTLRASLECVLRLSWLVDPSSAATTREARALTAALWQARQRTDLSTKEGPTVDDILAVASEAELKIDRNKHGDPIGVAGQRWPSAGQLLEGADSYLGLEREPETPGLDHAYAVLSATPHGSSWLTVALLTKFKMPTDFWVNSRELLSFCLDGVWFYAHAIEQFCETVGVTGPLPQPWFGTLMSELGSMVREGIDAR